MQVRCKGIVIRLIKHTERSMILRAYTDQFGLRSYLVRPTRKTPKGLFRPLTILDMSVQERNDRDLQQLKEVALFESAPGQDGDMMQSALAMFIQEFLVHALKEESADEGLFGLLHRTILAIKGNPGAWSAQQFLVAYGIHMGIMAPADDVEAEWYDLESGEFTMIQPPHIHCFGRPWSTILPQLQDSVLGVDPSIDCTPEERRAMLEKLLLIFRYHTHQPFELKSPEILREVLVQQ